METFSLLLWYIWEQFCLCLIGYLSLTRGPQSAVRICTSTTAVSNMCLWCETLKLHSRCNGSKSSLPWEWRHYEVWQHMFLQQKNIIIMHSHGSFYNTQLTHDLFSQNYCCAVTQIWWLWRDLIWSGCLALRCLYNLMPYGQFGDHRDFFFF